jgi:hypothetical protein
VARERSEQLICRDKSLGTKESFNSELPEFDNSSRVFGEGTGVPRRGAWSQGPTGNAEGIERCIVL